MLLILTVDWYCPKDTGWTPMLILKIMPEGFSSTEREWGLNVTFLLRDSTTDRTAFYTRTKNVNLSSIIECANILLKGLCINTIKYFLCNKYILFS